MDIMGLREYHIGAHSIFCLDSRYKVAPLATLMMLQLGTIGSCSVVNYSTRVTINVLEEY